MKYVLGTPVNKRIQRNKIPFCSLLISSASFVSIKIENIKDILSYNPKTSVYDIASVILENYFIMLESGSKSQKFNKKSGGAS